METGKRESRRLKKGDVRSGITVKCLICGYEGKTIAHHLLNMHGLIVDKYKEKFEVDRVSSVDVGFSSGKNNPAHGHGGRFSKWSKNYIYGYDIDVHERSKAEHSRFQSNNPYNKFRRESYSSNEEYSKAQARNLDWFIEKFGEEDGARRHALKTHRWMKSFKHMNFSMASQRLFNAIRYPGSYYATKENPGMETYVNKEFILKADKSTFRLDYYVPCISKAIEFDGDYWHHESKVNPEREARRERAITSMGISVFRVSEKDAKRDFDGTVQKCINFLTS